MKLRILAKMPAKMASIVIVIFLGACASQPESPNTASADPDPWEGFNRKVFVFNMKLDSWVLKPTAKGYDFITPDPVQKGIGNFFDNIGEVPNVVNDVFQWKWKRAGLDSSRFVINSTVGLLGFFDVASVWGIEESTGEDAGQTLGHWGVKRGPYLVLPVFGSTTLRDGLMRPVDWYLDPVNYVMPDSDRLILSVTRLIDTRAGFLEVEDLASGDLYIFVRDAYLQRRKFQEADGKLKNEFEDDFGSDFGSGEDF